MDIDKHNIIREILGFKDVYNLYPWEQVAFSVHTHWNFLKLSSKKCPLCNSNLLSIIYQPHRYNRSFDTRDIYICTSCQSQFDEYLNNLRNNYVIDTDYIKSINPTLLRLIELIESMGCRIILDKTIGYDGILLFEFQNEKFGIWIEDSQSVNIFFPNWRKITELELTQEIIRAVQLFNNRHQVCIYWLYDSGCYTFSTNISIDCKLIKGLSIDDIKGILYKLIESKDFDEDKKIEVGQYEPSYEETNHIESTLRACGCKNIELDDDGDFQFNWNGHNMYLYALFGGNYKLVYPLVILEDKTVYDDDYYSDGVDMDTLPIQWSNKIYPIKCSFYKPDDRHTCIRATVNIDRLFLGNSYEDYLSNVMNQLTHFFDDCLFDLLYGTETGIEIINTYYQPDVNNYENQV